MPIEASVESQVTTIEVKEQSSCQRGLRQMRVGLEDVWVDDIHTTADHVVRSDNATAMTH
ncbi:hypothetical protein CVT25_009394 [Psilocybe cyanescens]|uniref:Uncharacterized protein n=1 Tax=Psilocybe cyanescens TaxID=93625 RepID=A0A409XVG1_PSICY|nr:hypothetical protein CVT25_009394 [Psilocybe cyanescens]